MFSQFIYRYRDSFQQNFFARLHFTEHYVLSRRHQQGWREQKYKCDLVCEQLLALETNYIWHQETHRIYRNHREFYQCHLQAATDLMVSGRKPLRSFSPFLPQVNFGIRQPIKKELSRAVSASFITRWVAFEPRKLAIQTVGELPKERKRTTNCVDVSCLRNLANTPGVVDNTQ